jgi:hypothetical protein
MRRSSCYQTIDGLYHCTRYRICAFADVPDGRLQRGVKCRMRRGFECTNDQARREAEEEAQRFAGEELLRQANAILEDK